MFYVRFFVFLSFLFNCLGPIPVEANELVLPKPGVMVHLSPNFTPAHLRGLVIDKNDPFRIDFFVNKGKQSFSNEEKKEEYKDLVKYFLAALAIPDEDQWVNLSPYEKDRIIADDFSRTTMGRDLLAMDYTLKQITASIIYPEEKTGKDFWSRVYEQAQKQFGTTNVPVNTFNKVWIVPEKAVVYENAKTGAVYIVESKLKVLLDADYLSMQKHTSQSMTEQQIGTNVVREIVIPQLTKEVNEGKNFAKLRQMYSAMILATWYKRSMKNGLLAKVYADKAKLKGIDQDPKANQAIYESYLKAFKQGVYNYIKEEKDPVTQELIPRKYFSGGFTGLGASSMAMKAFEVLQNPPVGAEGNSFAMEAGSGEIDDLKVRLDQPGTDTGVQLAGASSAAMKSMRKSLALLGVYLMGQLSPLLAFDPDTQKAIADQTVALGGHGIQQDLKDLNIVPNEIFKKYIKDHKGLVNNPQIFMELMTEIRYKDFTKDQVPYDTFVSFIKMSKSIGELKKKLAKKTIADKEIELLNKLNFQIAFLIHLICRDTFPNSITQSTVGGLLETKEGNSIARTTLEVFMAHEMGVQVFSVNVDFFNKFHYPILLDGQTVRNVMSAVPVYDKTGVIIGYHYFDYNIEISPEDRSTVLKVFVFDHKTGESIVVNGFEAYANTEFRFDSFEDIIFMDNAYIEYLRIYQSLTRVHYAPGRDNYSASIKETVPVVEQLQAWLKKYQAVVKAHPDLFSFANNLELLRGAPEPVKALANVNSDPTKKAAIADQYNATLSFLINRCNQVVLLLAKPNLTDTDLITASGLLGEIQAVIEKSAEYFGSEGVLLGMGDKNGASIEPSALFTRVTSDPRTIANALERSLNALGEDLKNKRKLIDSPSSTAVDIYSLEKEYKRLFQEFNIFKESNDRKNIERIYREVVALYNRTRSTPLRDPVVALSSRVTGRALGLGIKPIRSPAMATDPKASPAMVLQPLGGIDFNGKNLDLQVDGDKAMNMSFDPALWKDIDIQGLVPVIIDIKPILDWGSFK